MTADFTDTAEDTLLCIHFKFKLCAHLLRQTEANLNAYVSVSLTTYIREVPASNICRDSNYTDTA